jgi:hypothetical protein
LCWKGERETGGGERRERASGSLDVIKRAKSSPAGRGPFLFVPFLIRVYTTENEEEKDESEKKKNQGAFALRRIF